MKNLFLASFFLILISPLCFSQIQAVTKDGQNVLLFNNGTWKYNETSISVEPSTQGCENLFKRIENEENGDVSYSLVDDIIVFDGINGFSLNLTKKNNTVHAEANVVSANDCIDDNANINLTFMDGSRLLLVSDSKSNCRAEVFIDFLGVYGKEAEFYQLSTKEIQSIRIWTTDGSVEQHLSRDKAAEFINAFSCALAVSNL